ncbi:TetR/AcrR family transcriptional regulator [soil metagenome]
MPTDGTDSGERERIIAAAHDELTRWGIDRFSVAAMAERHGIDPDSVWRYWDDEESVVLEALLDAPSRAIALPDTGALCDDLAQLASEMAAYLMTDEGRRLLRAHVITNDDSSRISVRRDAWSLGAHALHDIFDRARLRGEISGDVEERMAFELLFAPLNMRVLVTGEAVDDAYCTNLAEWVCRAATSA